VSPAVSSAVLIRRAVRASSQRALAARLRCSTSTLNRALRSIDPLAAVLDALGLEVRART